MEMGLIQLFELDSFASHMSHHWLRVVFADFDRSLDAGRCVCESNLQQIGSQILQTCAS